MSRLCLRFKKPECKKKRSLLMCFYKKNVFLPFLLGAMSQFVTLSSQLNPNEKVWVLHKSCNPRD